MSSKFGRFPTRQTGSIGSIMADDSHDSDAGAGRRALSERVRPTGRLVDRNHERQPDIHT